MTDPSNTDPDVRTVDALLDVLQREGLVGDERRAEVERVADDLASGVSDDPWYLQGLAGAGAWVAAALIVASLSCSGLVELSGIYPFVWGGSFLGVGVLAHLLGEESNVFTRQFSLATALIGEGLLVAGLHEQRGLAVTTLFYGGLTGLLYPIISADSHRFISSFGALSLATALVGKMGSGPAYTALFALEMVGICAAFSEDHLMSRGLKLVLRPLGLAAAISLIWFSSELYMREFVGLSTAWPYAAVAAVGLLFLGGQIVGRLPEVTWPVFVGGAAAVVGLAVTSTPSVLVAFTVVLAGLLRRATALLVLGAGALVYNVGTFYYAISLTVYAKALTMVASGAVLLALAWGLRWWRSRAIAEREAAS